MNIEEIWLPVVGYESYFEISNCGNIRSLERIICFETKSKSGKPITKTNIIKSKNLKISIGNHGYYQVNLCVNGTQKTVNVHRLVAKAFIPNPENKPEVNHKDGVKTNCTVFNLEWNTCSENNQHAYDTGLRQSTWTDKFGADAPRSKPVIQLDKIGNVLNRFTCAREAERKTSVRYQHISSCCVGKRLSAGGYVWKFDNNL
jgi:hypothetical protein